jgi:hypothetical protein
MADVQQLAVARQGVHVWNPWRAQNLGVHVDLTEAELSGAELSGADLSGAHLSNATPRRVEEILKLAAVRPPSRTVDAC